MAIPDERLWRAEERLWLEGADVYDELVAPDCLMVFPGVGVLDRESAVRGLAAAPRWASVEMSERRLSRFGRDVAVLAYRAAGQRTGSSEYACFGSSTYRGSESGWRLIQHQQTVID